MPSLKQSIHAGLIGGLVSAVEHLDESDGTHGAVKAKRVKRWGARVNAPSLCTPRRVKGLNLLVFM